MFWEGQDGYYLALRQVDPVSSEPINKFISGKDNYSYLFMVMEGDFNNLFRFACITSQLMFDIYTKIEVEQLLFLWGNQNKLRVEQLCTSGMPSLLIVLTHRTLDSQMF